MLTCHSGLSILGKKGYTVSPRGANSQMGQGSSSSDSVKLALLGNDMAYLKSSVDKIDEKLSSGYVTKEEFDPIKRIVYGLISLVLIAVVGALLALVVK